MGVWEEGCIRKKDRRRLIISQARKRANQVKQVNVVARARKTRVQSLDIESLQPVPRLPSPNPKTMREKEERHNAAAQNP